jgi:trk system potassium uptake protein TrkA
MYILIAGGGKVGRTLTHELLDMRHEVTLIEQSANRYRLLEEELEHVVQHGDATELMVL